jgi:hypothetical protein
MKSPAPTQLPAVASARPWKLTAQTQREHLGGYCTMSHAIAYPGGEMQLNQRIEDSGEGYCEGQDRAKLICEAVNAYDRNQATIAQLAKALRRYGIHDKNCAEFSQSANQFNEGLVQDSAFPCDCGFETVLNAAQGSQ